MLNTMAFKAAPFAGAGVGKPTATQARARLVVMGAVKTGDIAPAFTLKDQNNKNVSVKFGGKPKIVFFYPKDNTPGCTLEAKAFRDAYSQLHKLGADVIGVSSDSVDSHASFCGELELPYTLLSDEGDSVRQLYGVPKDLFGLLPGRQTFVVGKDGTVKLVFNNQFKPEEHVEKALKVLEEETAAGGSGFSWPQLFKK